MLPKRDFNFIKTDPETPKTQLVIVIGLMIISIIFKNQSFALAGLVIGLISLIIPPAGHGIVWSWYKLAEVLSRVVNPLVLGLLYFFFITPIAVLFRLFGNDPLSLQKPRGSLFDYHEKTYKKKDLKNPW